MNQRYLLFIALTLSLAVLLGAGASTNAAATDLFISEYIEGSSFNKAIEIYNGTGSAVDLAAGSYSLELYSNGSATASQAAALSGAIAAGDVFVLAHASAAPAILAETDVTNSTVINFNGDDAVVLRKNGVVIDAFGQIGVDPGSQWPGGGQDDTLRRAETVCAGDANPNDVFDAAVEWVTFAVDTFDGLGSHSATCGGGSADPVIIINEVDSDTPGTDVLEFVELYDGGVGNSALDGLTVVFYNGSNDLSYAAYDLDGFSTDANGYFLLGNAGVVPAPSIVFASNGLQNGADAVALYADDAANFPANTPITTANLLDAIVYDTSDADDAGLLVLLNAGQPQVDENGGGDGANHSNQRCPNGSGGARNTDAYAQFAPTPGDINTCVIPITLVKIHEVQGNGSASPLVGATVAIEGIVVGDFQDGAAGTNGDLNGFHVQEEDADMDADPATSEGIFVFNGSSPAVDVQIGDLVRVEGVVSEFNGLTEITSFTGVTVISSGNALPTTSVLSLPVTSVDAFEAYEGMLVTFPQALVISEYFNFDRFGEIVLTSERRLTPTAQFEPGPDAIQAAQDFLLNKITLDDGRTSQNPDPAIHPNGGVFDLTNLFRGGDTVANVTGVMDYSFGLYRIQPTQGADYTSANPRTATPDPVGGDIKVASFNVLNYFTTLDYPTGDPLDNKCGPLENQECRGADADQPLEFTRQRDKIIAALTAIDADVVGLLEIENNVNDDAVIDLVNGLNAAYGAAVYDYVSTGPVGTDA
ncbi:MAG: ExeM/NucH family extracellular endonuclease, partial [Chloroflexota bacterium]